MKETLKDLLCQIRDAWQDIWNPTKWAWQRLARGWDDRVVWDITSYLVEMIPAWLQTLKEQQYGVPCLVYNGDDADLEASKQKWDEILNDIIVGFGAAKQIRNLDYPIFDELYQLQCERYGRLLKPWDDQDNALLDNLYEEIDFRATIQAQEDEAMTKFRKGMALFTEHYFSLWD